MVEIVWFGEAPSLDVALVGGKAASLSRLAGHHLVPPAFCLTTAAYDAWSRTARPAHRQPGPGLPASLRTALRRAYGELERRSGTDQVRVAVRSSAIDEDGAEASFAGQHETFLNVVGADAIAEALVRCWTSGRSQRALAYRQSSGLDGGQIRLAVLVQQLVPADTAAVVFSADPVTGQRDQVLIDASFGLGESIVSGSVTPDAYRVDKRTRTVVGRDIGSKTVMHIPVPGGTREVPVPRPLRSQAALSDDQCATCADLAITLEGEMGHPVDLECAFQDDRLYLLQCRPITRLPPDPQDAVSEVAPDPDPDHADPRPPHQQA